MTRRAQGILGTLLMLAGIAGVLVVGGLSASGDERSPEDHATMHEMMDEMHGPGTSARMHRVEGAEEMMGRSAEMMSMMDGGTTDDGMMDGMMDGMRP